MDPAQIKAIRHETGLTQTQFANLLGIKDLKTIRRWETGESPIAGPVLILLEMLKRGEFPKRRLAAARKST